jgi:hypothetical protein
VWPFGLGPPLRLKLNVEFGQEPDFRPVRQVRL